MRAAAIGKFDALHRGHRALLECAATMGEPLLLGFSGMAAVLGWEERLPIVAERDRARVLERWSQELGRSIMTLDLPFAELRELTPADFVGLLHRRYGIGALVTGEDFRFGRQRSGDVALLRRLGEERGIAVATVPGVLHEGEPVSSSRVRAALAAGDVALATALLGRPHRLCARVGRGDGRGRGLGFPTANCVGLANLVPASGVYAAHAHLDAGPPLPAAVNVGHLPTLGDPRPLSVEAHLIGWSGDCYDAEIALDFAVRLRAERRFAGLEGLRAQIARDVAAAQAAL